MSAPHVLVIDNDAEFSQELQSVLLERGCTVSVVEDGQLGLDEAQIHRPALIILAIELRGMNGFAVCNKLKKHPELQHIPLVVVASSAAQETFEQHSKLRTHAQEYLHKPITVDALLEKCSTYVTLPGAEGFFESESDAISLDDLSLDEFEEHTVIAPMPTAPVAFSAPATPPKPPAVSPAGPPPPPPPPPPAAAVSQPSDGMLDDLDSFADAAFDSIILNDGDKPHVDASAVLPPVVAEEPPAVASESPELPPVNEPEPEPEPVVSAPPAELPPLDARELETPAPLSVHPPSDAANMVEPEPQADVQSAREIAGSLQPPSGDDASPDVQAEVASMREELATIRGSLERALRERAESAQQVDVLERALAEAQETRQRLDLTVAELSAAPKEDRSAALQGQLDQALASVESLQKERESLAAQASSGAVDLQTIQRLQAELDESRSKAAVAAAAQNVSRASVAPPSGSGSTREFLELRENLHRKDKEILQLKDELNARERSALEAKEKLSALGHEKADLDEKLLSRERAIADAEDQVAALQTELAAASEVQSALKAERDAAEAKARAHQASLDQAAQSLLASENALKALQSKHDNAATEATQAAEAQAQALSALKAAHEQALADLASKHAAEGESQAKTQREQLEQLEGKHSAEVLRITAELEQANTDLQKSQQDTLAQRDALRAECDALKTERDGLVAARDALVSERDAQKLAVEALEGSKRELEQQAEAAGARLTSLKSAITALGALLSDA
ncbi:MAG: response regulator [Deltaproteobacteria bacterium]|nr:response regulator [Deltaproteobacteria bacterium]